jgi:hypothetical protein
VNTCSQLYSQEAALCKDYIIVVDFKLVLAGINVIAETLETTNCVDVVKDLFRRNNVKTSALLARASIHSFVNKMHRYIESEVSDTSSSV